MGTILIGGKRYELIVDHKNGWNPSAFRDRYSDVLERYDYIIGDWGYNQLRLKGFFRDNHPKGSKDSFISGLVDYINEYCNFGCAYFVIQRHETSEQELAAMNEPDLLLTPPSTEGGGEDAVVALDENGDPIVLREHIRKPHPVRKEAPVRAERPGQEQGAGRPNKNNAQSQRKDVRISSDRKESDEFFMESSLDRRGSDQRGGQKGERRGSDQQRASNGSSRGNERSGGEQPRGGKQQQRGGNEKSGGEMSRGKEQQSRGQEQRGGQPRSGGQPPRGGSNGPRGNEQQRGGQPRGGQQRFDSELAADGFPAEGRQQARIKHRKGQKRLPIPPREQTVAATSEAALTQRPKPTGGDNGGES
ncbi:uncharacterized protein YutD [Paenibacillus cellulosilyticus]|uniref:Uncharacterized protein YutD n=1 Tax=Paenibacillus cellulosilyticus TaxID=375489 RepID=A0A2V2YTA2_9BACL|nr:YutD family protein [Paenibacillus cellulosilyticus]PWW02552.1 uncharacterized protein YutD [Paenibacillus cellulosilyticus]